MVLRGLGTCETCGARYILRAGVGLQKYQPHYFDCSDCRAPIVIAVRVDHEGSRYQAEENFILDADGEMNRTVVNLHPSFAFDPEDYHSDNVFPSIAYLEKIYPSIRDTLETEPELIDAARVFDVPNTLEVWQQVHRALRLESRPENKSALRKCLNQYLALRHKYRPDIEAKCVDSMLRSFFDSLFFPQLNWLLEPALELRNAAEDAFPEEFSSFKDWYARELGSEQKERFITTFQDYFRHFTQYSQMLVHARLGEEPPEPKIVGSKAFDEIKLYYGQAFEALTSAFVIPACLNNILRGRAFDQFERMTLNKYQKDVDKAKRACPFEAESAFFVLSNGLDAGLRNGSHHASIRRDQELIYFRSGGSGRERDMPFSTYLHECNRLTISIAVLWLIDRTLK